ncbi:MAG: glycosyltransferase family 4 protein [Oscillatoriales cyanobacterium RM2_1_1]|nr:glycosyltransferase family 4 protein [Oscillatoriales cyanobacterium SM2_3_0]NJO46124.1 glycosyltransferase family 4 protein [Oscillatoriales cyanobacterium RM2_1_1]
MSGQTSGQPSDLLDLIPVNAEIVVAVGAIPAELVAQYYRINPRVQWINLATPDLSYSDLQSETVDCLVWDATLIPDRHPVEHSDFEHSNLEYFNFEYFNVEQLPEILHRLRQGGQVLANIPNPQYWRNIVNLVRGKLESFPRLSGLTLGMIQNRFQEAGLQIYEIQTRGQKDQEFQQFQQLLQPMIQALGLEPSRFATQTAAQRYIVRAIKSTQPPRRLLIQTLMMAPTACDRVRVLEPDQFSRTIPGVRAVAAAKAWPQVAPVPGEEKVFIWQRTIMSRGEHLPRLQQLLQQGYLIIAEIDDNPLRRPEYAENHYLSYRGCHGVQTSTEPLATFLRQLNPNVAVFQNQLAYLPPLDMAKKVDPEKVNQARRVTLFFGALNRERDWQPIMAALNRVLVDYQDQVQVKVIHDRQFFDRLAIPQKDFEPFCSYDRYQAILQTCDLSLLPLAPTTVNLMKSDLKFIECAGHGVAVLASPTVYQGSIIDGETGLIYRTVKQFEAQLRELINHHELRQKMATNAYHWVRDQRLLCQHYHHRRDWYLQLRDQLPQLNRELRDRVPELFTES